VGNEVRGVAEEEKRNDEKVAHLRDPQWVSEGRHKTGGQPDHMPISKGGNTAHLLKKTHKFREQLETGRTKKKKL